LTRGQAQNPRAELIAMPLCADGRVRKDESGFTLVEILVAVTILLVGVLGVTTMISVSDKTTVVNNARQGATAVVRRVLETSRSLSFRSIKSATLASSIHTERGRLSGAKPARAVGTVPAVAGTEGGAAVVIPVLHSVREGSPMLTGGGSPLKRVVMRVLHDFQE
jgi:prepilin-type N-terminal cleavage/methylation domain-containing protein